MANFRKSACTGRRHGKFSDLGRNPMHSETGANRASPWPIFGNRLSQGVAMANFRIWKSVLTGRRHGQFSETCVHMAPFPRSLHVDTPVPIPAFASLCLHRVKVFRGPRCPKISPSVRPSLHPSVLSSVHPSLSPARPSVCPSPRPPVDPSVGLRAEALEA